MDFQYPRFHFGIRFIMQLGMLAGLLFLLSIPGTDGLWLFGFGTLLFVAIALVTFTPLLTCHEITDGKLILRQGLLFKAVLKFTEIEKIELTGMRLWAFGLFPVGARGRIVLASGSRNLVSVRLKSRCRFGMLLWRSANELIIDLEKPDEFVRLANEQIA